MLLTSLCATSALSLSLQTINCRNDSNPISLASSASAFYVKDNGSLENSQLSTSDRVAPIAASTHTGASHPQLKPNKAPYLLGAAQADITGAAAETGMFGYAAQQVAQGINDRLYAHAFIIVDNQADSAQTAQNSARIVYVSADMGAMFNAVRLEVLKRLHALYGPLYTDANVMLTATHTHVGNAGYSHQRLYQIASKDDTTAGYSEQNFTAIVDGIVRAISKAHQSLTPGTLSLAQGKLTGATRNRSAAAYNNNPDAKAYDSNVNDTMTQLRLDDQNGKPLGAINWFAIHPTSFSNQFMYLSADNKGYAQQGMQAAITKKTGQPFVAAFANADEGDVVAAGGNAHSSAGFEGEDEEWHNVVRDGSLQLNKALELWDKAEPIVGPIDTRARWIDLNGYVVDAQYTHGAGEQRLCVPARGYAFAAGAENGPSDIPGIYEGMTKDSLSITDKINRTDTSILGSATRAAFGVVGAVSQDPCQAEKPVLLPTGKLGWVNSKQPVQLMRIANLALVAIPGEPTTMVGRRLQSAVLHELKDSGVNTVIVNGLANNYSGYVATREEYALQHYEGASTEYGPYQSNAYVQEYVQLARALKHNQPLKNHTAPPSIAAGKFAERPGVVFDDKPFNQAWGQVLVQPKQHYQKAEVVSVSFRGAHPKNNLRTEDTFLKVQRLVQGKWVDYLTDASFDTRYSWAREGITYSKVTIDWRIDKDTPSGTYRILHQGDWKNGWDGKITAYAGASYAFEVE